MPVDFYTELPTLSRFADLADAGAYAPLPPSWSVVITDVVGSTQAVADGRYRDVNYVGAASIAAVLNASDRVDVPFVFGGDGATLALPPDLLPEALRALATLQEHAAERLGLPLRVGVVPVREILDAGHGVAVARYAVSPAYTQALFLGEGLAWAEGRVKHPGTAERYASGAEPSDVPDPYAGLECRWEDIPSPHGETVSLLVAAADADRPATYREVLALVERVYGAGDEAHPIAIDRLRLALTPGRMRPESRLRRADRPRRHGLRLWALNAVGRVLVGLGLETAETHWGEYPRRLRAATDYRKFDGVLRMVLAGTAAQREALDRALAALHAAGRVAYGLHVSDRAVMTCLVYERMGQQVHFVDGAGGGYTAAAVPFKAQLKRLAAAADT